MHAGPGRRPARPPHRDPRRADQPARARPGTPGRHRRLEDRAAPAHLPAGRAHLPADHQRAGQGRARRRPLRATCSGCATSCWKPASPRAFKDASTSLAVDWTDVEAWARPVPASSPGTGTDPEARWGHRNVNRKIQEGEMFFGYYLSARDHGERRATAPPCPSSRAGSPSAPAPTTPPPPWSRVLAAMPAGGASPGDILADSGYSHRVPATWAEPAARPPAPAWSQDLHPNDRGPQRHPPGRDHRNGNLYCPATPGPLLRTGAAAARRQRADDRRARPEDRRAGPLQARRPRRRRRRRLPPARLPRRRREDPLPAPPRVDETRPEPARDPHARREHPPACCTQQTITAGPARRGENPAEARLPLAGVADLLRGGAPPPNGSTPPSRTPPSTPSTAAGSA